jgi:2-dehydropantoate 2-reductase
VAGPDSDVVLMQNGLNMERQVALYTGNPKQVIGGLCFICSNKVGPGHVRHLDYGRVMFGRFDPDGGKVAVDDRLRTVAADFEAAGIPTILTDDLVEARWRKLVWNIPYNGLSVVLDARTDELMANRQSAQLVEALMWEVVTDCQAVTGRTIEPAFVEKMISDTVKMKPYRPSMKIDYDEKRPMEIEAIYGNPVRAAQHAGADSPLIEALYQQLCFLDQRNRDTTP